MCQNYLKKMLKLLIQINVISKHYILINKMFNMKNLTKRFLYFKFIAIFNY